MPERFTAACLLVALVASTTTGAEHGPAERSMFGQFVGVCQASVQPGQAELWKNISLIREDLHWSALQPKDPEDWNQKYLDDWGQRVLRARQHGVELLPMLGYMVDWAARRRAWSFTFAGKRYDVAAGDEPGTRRQGIVTDLKTGEKKETTHSTGRLPPENVADWERYVDGVVSFLSKPPYNVRYFQPWNEADDRFTGFWVGGMDEYMQTIHLPAARIIRKYGGKVVYGGYPCSGNMQHLIQVCEKHNAWDTMDVIDIHYFPLSSWEYLYQRVLKRGRVWGLWQTEVGFTKRTDWVPNNYPRFFHWAITHDWQPDRYKFCQFAYWSPDDPKAYGYKCCFIRGNRLSHHGRALVTLGQLLDSTTIEPLADWRTDPVLRTELSERRSSVEGFDTGNRIVLAVHLMKENDAAIFTDWNLTLDNLHLDWPSTTMKVYLPKLDPAEVASAHRVGIYGSRLPVPIEPEGAGCRLTVPVADGEPEERKDNRAAPTTTFYVAVEKK